MNEHENILALIPGYPELPTPERRRVDEHAQSCDECAAALQRQGRLRSQLAHAPRLAPSPAVMEAVRAAVRQKASTPDTDGGRARRPRWLTVAAPAGVFALVAVLVGLLVVRQGWMLGGDAASSGRGQGSRPAARSAAVGEFVWQTDGAYGYEMLRPAGWTISDAGYGRDFTAPRSNEAEALTLYVLNLRAKPIAESRWGMGAWRDKFEATATLQEWIARLDEYDFRGVEKAALPEDLVAEAVIYIGQTGNQQIQLMAFKASEGQPLLISLAGGAAAHDLDALKASGLWYDFVTMLRSARAIAVDAEQVSPWAPTATPTVAAAEPQAVAPEMTAIAPASPEATVAPAATPLDALPATCAVEDPDTLLLVSPESGYCLRYPAAFQPLSSDAPERPAGTWGISLIDPGDPDRTVSLLIETSLTNGRTLGQVVSEELAHYRSEPAIQADTPRQLGGERVVILDRLPGILMNRQAFVIHGDRLHHLVLLPWHDAAFADRQAEAQALWEQVTNSLAFIPALDAADLGTLLHADATATVLQRVEAGGLAAELRAVDLTTSELAAEVCLDLPDNRDWQPMPRLWLSQGERQIELDGYSVSLVDGKLTQTAYATHRCYRFAFPLSTPGFSVVEPLTFSIERLALEPNEGEMGQAATCEAALQRLAVRQPGITAECVAQGDGTYPGLVSLPEGMNRDQAQRLIYEGYSEFVDGPWMFTIPLANVDPTE